ncbi:MAG TPA: hypothetical protein VLT86_08650 [Vicinamibacterales bacterium]|nr:hypothetical protein [Vicinamibacterales bacterium]
MSHERHVADAGRVKDLHRERPPTTGASYQSAIGNRKSGNRRASVIDDRHRAIGHRIGHRVIASAIGHRPSASGHRPSGHRPSHRASAIASAIGRRTGPWAVASGHGAVDLDGSRWSMIDAIIDHRFRLSITDIDCRSPMSIIDDRWLFDYPIIDYRLPIIRI